MAGLVALDSGVIGTLLHLWLVLRLWSIFITFMIGITFMVSITFMGDTPVNARDSNISSLLFQRCSK